MEWSEKEKEALDRVVVSTQAQDDLVLAVANKAAEMLAARDGTMTAEGLADALSTISTSGVGWVLLELRPHIAAQGARNAVLEGLNASAGEELSRLKREVERLEAERDEAERLGRVVVEERDEARQQRDTLSQRLTETNQRAQQNWEKQEAERERLRNELGDALVRAGQAEARMRQLAIAGQELSAEVDKHVGEGNAASRLATLEELLSPTVLIGYLSAHPPHTRTEANALRWPWESLEKVAALFNDWSKMAQRYPCSPTCTHDDAAFPGHAGVISEPNPSTASNGSEPNTGNPERAVERSSAFASLVLKDNAEDEPMSPAMQAAYESGAEAMRAACLEAVLAWAQGRGLTRDETQGLNAAIEEATP